MRRVDADVRHNPSKRWLGAALCTVILPFAERAWAAPASSPELPTDPILATLIDQSLAARPELAQARAEVQAERERVPQAGAWPDPVLQLGVQNDGFTSWEVGKMESSYYSIMASQTVPWPGKRRLASEVAALAAEQAEQSVARLLLATEAEVRRAYLDLVLNRDRLAQLARLEAVWQKSAATARAKYETGQGAQSDVLRAQLELNRIRQRRWALQAEADAEVQALNRLRGHPLEEPIETSVHLADLPTPVLGDSAALEEEARQKSPELEAARLGVTQAKRSASLTRKGYFPDLTVTAGVMPRGGDFPPMWLATVGIPLPVFASGKQSRAVKEGEARILASEKNAEALAQVLRLRVQQRHTALAAALETVRLYQDGLLVQSEATASSTLAQYEVGNVTFASVLEANAGLIADEEGYLEALAQAHRLAIERAEVSLGSVAPGAVGSQGTAMPGAGAMRRAPPAPTSGTTRQQAQRGSSSSMSSM